MREQLLVPDDPVARLRAVLDLSWQVLLSRFVNGRHIIETEAPFQHHFANIIRTVGELYCTNRGDLFLVDLETKHDNIRAGNKYLDITCRVGRAGRETVRLRARVPPLRLRRLAGHAG